MNDRLNDGPTFNDPRLEDFANKVWPQDYIGSTSTDNPSPAGAEENPDLVDTVSDLTPVVPIGPEPLPATPSGIPAIRRPWNIGGTL